MNFLKLVGDLRPEGADLCQNGHFGDLGCTSDVLLGFIRGLSRDDAETLSCDLMEV